jgi:hypothetical protein
MASMLIENATLNVLRRYDSFAQTVLRSWRIKNSRFVAIRNSRAIAGGPQSGEARYLEIFIYGNSSFLFRTRQNCDDRTRFHARRPD